MNKLTRNLNAVEPYCSIGIASLRGFKKTGLGVDNSLWRKAAHSQKHVKDVGKLITLAGVLLRSFIERPLPIDRQHILKSFHFHETYPSCKSFVFPGHEQPASSLNTVKKNDGNQKGLEPATMMTLEETTFQLIHHKLTKVTCAFLNSPSQLAAQNVICFGVGIAVNWNPTIVS